MMKLWKDCTASEQNRLSQLLDDMIPYYERIAIYKIDNNFIHKHRQLCMSIALAARKVTFENSEIKAEDAVFSDDLFGKLISIAWEHVFSENEKLFFNANLQNAAECFRMGIMMADLPEV